MPTIGGLPSGPLTWGRPNYAALFPARPYAPAATLKAAPRTIGGSIQQGIAGLLGKIGVPERRAAQLGAKFMAPLNDATPVGNVTGAEEGKNLFQSGLSRGDLRSMGLGAGIFGLSVLPVPGGVKRAGKHVGKGMFGSMLKDNSGAIRAWHGSPHDFDKFEWSPRTRGTGEGAQAYGDGLYFAESPGVAKSYRAALSGPEQVRFAGEEIPSYHVLDNEKIDQLRRLYEARITPEDLPGIPKRKSDGAWQSIGPISLGRVLGAARSDAFAGKDAAAGLADLANNYRSLANARVTEMEKAEQLLKASIADQISKSGRFEVHQPGRLYEVNINAEPEDFLDYDAPLAQQPAALEALKSIDLSDAMSRTRKMLEWAREGTEQPHNLATGRELLNAISGYGERRSGDLTALQPYGIKGVQFLDQGSRGTGSGTRNFVVPDHSLIDILAKY